MNITQTILPLQFQKNFQYACTHTEELDSLLVKVSNKGKPGGVYRAIHETPHYTFVQAFINNKNDDGACGFKNYSDYNERNKHSTGSEEFIALIHDIKSNGFKQDGDPILVLKKRYKIFKKRTLVLDGAHRLAILKSLEEKKIIVTEVTRKSLIRRLLNIFSRKLEK